MVDGITFFFWDLGDSRGTGKPAANDNLQSMVKPTEILTVNRTSWTREIYQTLLQRWFLEEYWERTILHYNWWWWWCTWRSERIMSREYLTSKWGVIPREKVDPWKHEDRSSPGGEGVLSSKALRFGDQDRILISWQNLFLGPYLERNQHFRNRNVIINCCCKCWEQRYRKTCCEGQTTTDTDFNTVSCVYPLSWTKMERYWTRKFQPRFFLGVSKLIIRLLRHDDSLRREEDGAVRFDDLASIFWSEFDGTSHWSIRAWKSFLAKGGGGQKKRFQYCVKPNSSEHFLVLPSNPGTFGRYSRWSYIARQCTVTGWRRRLQLPHRERSRHALNHPEWIDWFREESLKRDRQSVFFKTVKTMCANQNQYDLDKPRVVVHKNTRRVDTKHSILVQLEACSDETDCSSIKHDPTQSPFSTLYLRYVLRKWYYMKTGEDLYSKVYRSPRLPRAVLTPNFHHGRQDLLNPEARTKRTKREVRGNSTLEIGGNLLRYCWLQNFKVYVTQQFRQKTLIAREAYKEWFTR